MKHAIEQLVPKCASCRSFVLLDGIKCAQLEAALQKLGIPDGATGPPQWSKRGMKIGTRVKLNMR
jgi:hypothetical protein